MGTRGKKYEYEGVEYDSPEETYMAMWLNSLQTAGYVHGWKKADLSIEITPKKSNVYTDGKKKKSQSLLQHLEYTPDFLIEWNENAKGLFYNKLGEKITLPFISGHTLSWVEVKPAFDRSNMTRLFRQRQKILYHFQNIYVNLIIVEKLFDSTFTPLELLKTKTGKDRKISKWNVRSLEDYIKSVE
jgi:hypothetical protein